ncbi:MAG: HAD family hydrolase [Butyricicoccus sp.]
MDKKFAIFDMDGTLIDSMGYWQRLGIEYLTGKGVTGDLTDVLERIKPMTMTESAALFSAEFGLAGTPAELAAEMNGIMETHYRADILLKPGVAAYLAALRADGVRLCVASATAPDLVAACLERLGVLDHFEFLLSCEEVGAGKDKPDVYLAAADRLGAQPGEAAVYEDALYAARTAKEAGFYTVGVYDPSGEAHWGEMTALADETITDW